MYFNLIRLMNVELEVASETGDGEMARSVEQCDCPAGHTGTSCEVASFKDAQLCRVYSRQGDWGITPPPPPPPPPNFLMIPPPLIFRTRGIFLYRQRRENIKIKVKC